MRGPAELDVVLADLARLADRGDQAKVASDALHWIYGRSVLDDSTHDETAPRATPPARSWVQTAIDAGNAVVVERRVRGRRPSQTTSAREEAALEVMADGQWHMATEVYEAIIGSKMTRRATMDGLIKAGTVESEGRIRGLKFKLSTSAARTMAPVVLAPMTKALIAAFSTGASYDLRDLLRVARKTSPLTELPDVQREIDVLLATKRIEKLTSPVGDRFRMRAKGAAA